MRRIWPSRFAGQVVVAALLSVPLVSAAAPRETLPGMTYTMRGSNALSRSTFVVLWAGGRGRMEVTEGAMAPMMAKGDYLLFDAEDFIVVHPLAHTFSGSPHIPDFAAMTGMTMRAQGLQASVDTLGAGEPVDGLPTRHYRSHLHYTMVMDMGIGEEGQVGGIESDVTTEYWFAEVANFPPSPMRSMADGAKAMMAGMMKEVAEKESFIKAGLPTGGTMVKITTSSKQSGPMMPEKGPSETTQEITGIRNADVDVTQLLLPAGFTEVPMAGMEAIGGSATKDGGAKWLTMPGGKR